MTAVVRDFPVAVDKGMLDLWFRPRAAEAIVSSVQVEPGYTVKGRHAGRQYAKRVSFASLHRSAMHSSGHPAR
jgi:hypothetical protein